MTISNFLLCWEKSFTGQFWQVNSSSIIAEDIESTDDIKISRVTYISCQNERFKRLPVEKGENMTDASAMIA